MSRFLPTIGPLVVEAWNDAPSPGLFLDAVYCRCQALLLLDLFRQGDQRGRLDGAGRTFRPRKPDPKTGPGMMARIEEYRGEDLEIALLMARGKCAARRLENPRRKTTGVSIFIKPATRCFA